MKKNLLTALTGALLLPCLLWSCSQGVDKSSLKEGDIVFQTSQSTQSEYIEQATGSDLTNCGIVIEKDHKLYVLEVSKVVVLTPIDEWAEKGKGGKIKHMKRVFDKPIKVNYERYLGTPHDLQLKFNNGLWYGAELVYEIYLKQFRHQLGKPKILRNYNIEGLDEVIRLRGIKPSQVVIAPADLL